MFLSAETHYANKKFQSSLNSTLKTNKNNQFAHNFCSKMANQSLTAKFLFWETLDYHGEKLSKMAKEIKIQSVYKWFHRHVSENKRLKNWEKGKKREGCFEHREDSLRKPLLKEGYRGNGKTKPDGRRYYLHYDTVGPGKTPKRAKRSSNPSGSREAKDSSFNLIVLINFQKKTWVELENLFNFRLFRGLTFRYWGTPKKKKFSRLKCFTLQNDLGPTEFLRYWPKSRKLTDVESSYSRGPPRSLEYFGQLVLVCLADHEKSHKN